jgi:hypothetical protein
MRVTSSQRVADLLRSIDHEFERIAHLMEQIKLSGHPNAEKIIEILCDAGDLSVTPGALELARPLLDENALRVPASRFDDVAE